MIVIPNVTEKTELTVANNRVARGAKRQRKSKEPPLQRDDAHAEVAYKNERKGVLRSCEARVKVPETRDHKHDQRAGNEHEARVAMVVFRVRVLSPLQLVHELAQLR